MFKAFLKRVEETTNLLEASLKIKDTAKPLDNIIKEIPPIPDSIKNIDLSLKPSGPPANFYKENIDLHPGSTFLKKYQEKLGELHSNNVILAKKAEAVDRKLPTLLRHTTGHQDIWRKLQGELARLPELSANVSNIRNQIDFVLVKFDELEVLLTAQVEMYHATELSKHKERLVVEGTKYQAHKQRELASLEEELATTRARLERDRMTKEKEQARLLRLEQDQQRRKKEEEEARERKRKQEQDLKEKKQKEEEDKKQQEKLRTAYGAAFQQQVDQFKQFGAVETAPKHTEPTTALESIVPEENPKALDEFFQDLVNSSDKLKKEAMGNEVKEEKEGTEQAEVDAASTETKEETTQITPDPETEPKEKSNDKDEKSEDKDVQEPTDKATEKKTDE